MDYNSLSDEVLEQHLNPRVAAPDFQQHQDANAARSAQTRANLASELDIPYGESPLERLDIFPSAQPGSPVQLFIHGGYWRAMDKNLYDLPAEELADIPTVCGSLREALEALASDHDFLLQGDVFTKDQIDGYSALKMEEVETYEHTPHPVEYGMYYSC